MSNMILALCLLFVGQDAGIPTGNSTFKVEVGGKTLDVFTYRPESYKDGPLILVCHGTLRNADEYRDHARKMGDRFGALIAAPRFDKEQFGQGMYQQGGLFRDGKVAARPNWTVSLVPEIAAAVRRKMGRPEMPYSMIGHSAGGQFVGRTAAFVDTGATRIVVANPSSYVLPTRDRPYPYGFGNLPEDLSNDAHLKRYLAQPVTIYLGTADTERDEDLDTSEGAERQGKSRLERGRLAFRTARDLAAERGWKFGWALVEAPGVPHDHDKMFNDPRCQAALFGETRLDGKP